MPAIPAHFLLGGSGINESHTPDGISLLDVLNGLAYDVSAVKGSAPSAITAPAGTAVPTITSPLAVAVPAHGVGALLAAYAVPATPTDVENAADRTRMNELRVAVIDHTNYLTAIQTEVALLRSYTAAFVTEVVALRAAQTARAGLTLHFSPQAAYTA